ncbi:glycoside hydrolase family 130 protein [Novosphingobium subterraneum]|uniref:Glycosidase related protein n=1 Tax=Novosphingobium subterraneum TaxID=48936 RepID=A0A0B9AC75_9SPHN|nr:glycosidase [Novosphingobium subterraneum]KHS48214.1 glycosidase related protein [Novosphingobium subterraneum]
MTTFPFDRLVFTPFMVDLAQSPLRGHFDAETYVLGAFNPGMTVLPNGNLLFMVRVAEALRQPIRDGKVHAIRWHDGGYVLDGWPLELADTSDPRKFLLHGGGWKIMALTSLSWLLPVEMSADGLDVIAIHYDKAIAPQGSFQCYGIEDARISRMGEGAYLMTTCSVSPERHSTTLYSSEDGLNWHFEGIALDHQNKDMLIFEGLVHGEYWAQTRPLGDLYFAYPPGSEWRSGPSINLATSPDALHWRPRLEPGIRPHAGTAATARMGGGTPPILTEIDGQRGWLTLWHGVEPKEIVGIYRTYWTLLDPEEPWKTIGGSHTPLLEPNPELTRPLEDLLYLRDVVFTTGIAELEDCYIVASGEADLACRITHVPKEAFRSA